MPNQRRFRIMNVRALAAGFAAALACCASFSAGAQEYPVKAVRFIAPYPPGGSSDVLARVFAQKLTDALGRQVVVENRPGAAGNIGHEVAVKSAPDGYTILLTTKSQMVNNPYLYRKLPFDPLADFSHVTLIATAGHVLVVHPAVPARSVTELIALARKLPGKLSYGSSGIGSTVGIVAEVFKSHTGTNILHVPYKGTVLAVADVVGGQIEMVFSDMVPAVPQIRSGRLRALAVTTGSRSPALPDVPTMTESGMTQPLPTQWWGIAGPRGIPGPVLGRLNAEAAKVLAAPEVKQRYSDLGIVPVHSSPERMRETIREDIPRMAKILAAIGLKPE